MTRFPFLVRSVPMTRSGDLVRFRRMTRSDCVVRSSVVTRSSDVVHSRWLTRSDRLVRSCSLTRSTCVVRSPDMTRSGSMVLLVSYDSHIVDGTLRVDGSLLPCGALTTAGSLSQSRSLLDRPVVLRQPCRNYSCLVAVAATTTVLNDRFGVVTLPPCSMLDGNLLLADTTDHRNLLLMSLANSEQ